MEAKEDLKASNDDNIEYLEIRGWTYESFMVADGGGYLKKVDGFIDPVDKKSYPPGLALAQQYQRDIKRLGGSLVLMKATGFEGAEIAQEEEE